MSQTPSSGAARPRSIRWSLIRSFVVVVLVASGAALVLLTIRARDTEQELSSRLIATGTAQVSRALDAFIDPARRTTRSALAWGRGGRLSLDWISGLEVDSEVTPEFVGRVRAISTLLSPIVESEPVVSSAMLATDLGHEVMILQAPEGRSLRVVDAERWPGRALWFELDEIGEPRTPEWRDIEYDPRTRDWFSGLEGVPDGDLFWTEPYAFFTTGDLGITASAAWRADGVRYVTGWDVLLTDLTSFTRSASRTLSPGARTLVVTPALLMAALPAGEEYEGEVAARGAFLTPLSEQAAPELRRLSDLSDRIRPPTSFDFRVDGRRWWVGVEPYELGPSRSAFVTVLIPNDDLLAAISAERIGLLVATLFALAGALLYAVQLSRTYSRPIEALAAQSRRIRDLDFSESEPIRAGLLEFQELAEAQRQSLHALRSFMKYVPVDVVTDLVGQDRVAEIGGRTEELTVMFTDIAGFTGMAERADPEALAEQLADYFGPVIETLKASGATIDKLIGDAVMAFWGAPRRVDDHAMRAVEGALAAHRLIARMNDEWRREGRPEFPTRIGLASGEAMVGNMGSRDRLAYTAVGDTVNLAARLESLNRWLGTWILADQALVDRVDGGGDFAWRRVGRVRVSGRLDATRVHELVPERTPAMATYEEAWALVEQRSFDVALRLLEGLDDGPARRLEELARACLASPPEDGWIPVLDPRSK